MRRDFAERAEEHAHRAGTTPHSLRTAARVLVAEADAQLRSIIVATLRGDGYEVMETASIEEAAQFVEESETSAGGVDLMLGDVSAGLAHGEHLDAMMHHTSTPLIFLAPYHEREFVDEAMRLGAHVIMKPFPLGQLRTAVLTTIAAHVRIYGLAARRGLLRGR